MINNEFLFVEKYRPSKIKDCILPSTIKKVFNDIISVGEIPNLILSGGPGCGKTTAAIALCEELNLEYIFINASEHGNIDTLRTTIRNFASTVSFNGNTKVVILDEADYLNPNSTQPALRSSIEEFSKNCRFIMTCNFKHKIMDAIQSRCTVIDFKIPSKEKPEMAKELLESIKNILNTEKIEYDTKVLSKLIISYFPDFRKIIGVIQTYSFSGKIDEGILVKFNDAEINELISYMKEKNFTNVRKWVAQNNEIDSSVLFRKFYDGISDVIKKENIPQVILILAEYQYKLAFSADPEICIAACLIEIMILDPFK